MQEAQPHITEQEIVTTPEFPLGAALNQDQLNGLKDFALDAYRSYWAGVDTQEEFAKQLASYGEGYTPELGKVLLTAVGSETELKGVESDPNQLLHVAKDEAAFQAVLVSSVLNGYHTAATMPRAYRVVAGADGLDAALEVVMEQSPEKILNNIKGLSAVFEPEKLDEKIVSAYEAFRSDETNQLRWIQLSEELIQSVGRERVSADFSKAIEEGGFFGARVSFYDVLHMAKLGLMSPDAALATSLDAFKQGAGLLDVYSLKEMIALDEKMHSTYKTRSTTLCWLLSTILNQMVR